MYEKQLDKKSATKVLQLFGETVASTQKNKNSALLHLNEGLRRTLLLSIIALQLVL